MARTRSIVAAAISLVCLGCSFVLAQGICDPQKQRALVLSGGGGKGAFEAGAMYHLIVHRSCDFQDISGVSVGALNGSFVADAPLGPASLPSLQDRTRRLVTFWLSISGPSDVLKHRFLGPARLALFGIENLYDFAPLVSLIAANVHPELIVQGGRQLRVGTVNFYSGEYLEVSPVSLATPDQFRDFVLGSALIPVFGKMPRIQTDPKETNSENWPQFADGGVRHQTPIATYFSPCDFLRVERQLRSERDLKRSGCLQPELPSHLKVQELVAIVADPYQPGADRLPPPACCPGPRKHVSDGRQIASRAVMDIVLDSPFRWDVNFALVANHMLEWRADLYSAAKSRLSAGGFADFEKAFQALVPTFPVRSTNDGPDGFPLPYKLGIISPDVAFTGTYGFDPKNIREQLRAGCLKADDMMVRDYGLPTMKDRCGEQPFN